MGRRSRFEIYLDLLRVIRNVHQPTRIMYSSNLSWVSLQECLDRLLELDLIRVEEVANTSRKKLYYLSDKGKKMLDYFRRVEEEFPLLFA